MTKLSSAAQAALVILALATGAHGAGMSRTPSPGSLYPGEGILTGAGFPALAKFEKGDGLRPLVVFVPGSAHLARIAYRCASCPRSWNEIKPEGLL